MPPPRTAPALMAILLFALALYSWCVHAQSSDTVDWEKAAGGKASFDVASVKQETSAVQARATNVPLGSGDAFTPTGGLFSVKNVSLDVLIDFAYKPTIEQSMAIMSQLPVWTKKNSYDVEARAKGDPTKDQFRLMVQALLVNRFKLALRFEVRQLPVFALVLAKPGKLGSNLRPHLDEPLCPSVSEAKLLHYPFATISGGYPLICDVVVPVRPQTPGFIGGEGGRNVTIQSIADTLTIYSDRPLIDKTGLTGTFDFFIEWTPETPMNNGAPEMQGIPLLPAMNEQLGLKSEATNAPLETAFVDHIEEPTPN